MRWSTERWLAGRPPTEGPRLPHGRCLCGQPAWCRARLRLCRTCAPETLADIIASLLGDDLASLEKWFAWVRELAIRRYPGRPVRRRT